MQLVFLFCLFVCEGQYLRTGQYTGRGYNPVIDQYSGTGHYPGRGEYPGEGQYIGTGPNRMNLPWMYPQQTVQGNQAMFRSAPGSSFTDPPTELLSFLSLKKTTPYQEACEFEPTVPMNCLCGIDATNRIVGGQQAHKRAHPWLAALYKNNLSTPICGATVISKRWVLTAAHCFDKDLNGTYKIRVGEYNILTKDRAEQEFIAKKVISHEEFNRRKGRNDIALVELDEIEFSSLVAPACLPLQFKNCTWEGYDVLTAGWGANDYGWGSVVVLETNLPIIPLKQCQWRMAVTTTHLCAYADGKDTCQGDSGGPALVYLKDHVFLVGIVSWGYGCARKDTPGVYTKVTEFLDWIHEKTGKMIG